MIYAKAELSMLTYFHLSFLAFENFLNIFLSLYLHHLYISQARHKRIRLMRFFVTTD